MPIALKAAATFLVTALVAAPSVADGQTSFAPAGIRDGQHDFDFDLGVWNTRITRRIHPLSGSEEAVQLTGTVTVRKVWDGRAQLEEIEAEGPKGHWEGLTLFLYNPDAHQWSMNFANSSAGTLTVPMIGSWNDGRAELFATDTLDGRAVLVRAVWSDIKPTSHTYQEFFSADGGKTWALSFTARKTKQ